MTSVGAPSGGASSAPLADGVPWLFHVGYVKTATTFLQRRVFRDAALGFALPGDRRHRGFIVSAIALADGFALDPPMVVEAFRRAAEPCLAQDLTPVWSEETLLGDPGSRRYDGYANAVKLKRCFPDARILITIREQTAMAVSIYKEYLKGSGVQGREAFFGRGDEPPGYGPILRDSFLAYDAAVRFYREAFGAENVCVLPYELLRMAPDAYAERLGAFLGRPVGPLESGREVNAAQGMAALGAKRFVNRVAVRSPLTGAKGTMSLTVDRLMRGIDRAIPAALDRRLDRRLKAAAQARYGTVFAESNAALQEMTGLSLGKLGYAV